MYVDVIYLLICGYCIYILYGVITFMMRSCNFCHACIVAQENEQRCRDVHVFGCCMLLFPQVVVACLETNPMIFTCIIFKQPQTTTNNPNRNSRYNHQPPKQKFQKKLKNIKNLKKNP